MDNLWVGLPSLPIGSGTRGLGWVFTNPMASLLERRYRVLLCEVQTATRQGQCADVLVEHGNGIKVSRGWDVERL